MNDKDRLKELDIIADKLEGTTIYKKNVWIVMDKLHKAVVKGASSKYLCMCSDIKDKKKILLYNDKGMAIRHIKGTYINTNNTVSKYLKDTYKYVYRGGGYMIWNDNFPDPILEPVKAVITIKI
jgi:hypothetical protein